MTDSGGAVSPGYVHLVNPADPNKSDLERLGKDGSFKFKYIAAGEYYLVLNLRNEAPSEDDAPYPRTYYPGVPEPGAAMKIVVAEGGKIENVTFRVGPPWTERVVSGKAVWQDGRTAQNASISLYDGKRYVRQFKPDEKGRFNFKVYGDFKYEIRAEVWGRIQGRSKPLPIGEKSTGLKLVVHPVE
ncbi:MAG TPA: hypothetical protein VJT15_10865 [Pyrinomonadaceae bacterium]|nr:hypothetical protein [Pyrinomonadaceae bacterium]